MTAIAPTGAPAAPVVVAPRVAVLRLPPALRFGPPMRLCGARCQPMGTVMAPPTSWRKPPLFPILAAKQTQLSCLCVLMPRHSCLMI
eukprot:14637559-Alexandrium_andersonii.AAC.1